MLNFASKTNDPDAKLGWGERIGYGAGACGWNMINGIIGSFLTVYFTNVALKALLSNKYWVIMFFAMLCIFFVIIFYSIGGVYYALYIFKDMGQYSWMGNSISIAQFAIMFITPFFMSKFGKRWMYAAGMALLTIGFLGFGLFGTSKIVMIICNVLKGCGLGIIFVTSFNLDRDLAKLRAEKGIAG